MDISQTRTTRAVLVFCRENKLTRAQLAEKAGIPTRRFYDRISGRTKWTLEEAFFLSQAGVEVPGIKPDYMPAWAK